MKANIPQFLALSSAVFGSDEKSAATRRAGQIIGNRILSPVLPVDAYHVACEMEERLWRRTEIMKLGNRAKHMRLLPESRWLTH